MLKQILPILILLSFLSGCGSDTPTPKTEPVVAPAPAASAVTTPASEAIAVSVPVPASSSLEIIEENPDYTEDRQVYAKDSSKVVDASVILFEKPGAAMRDLNNDTDSTDKFEPEVAVLFQEGDFGAGLTEANATMKVRGNSTRQADQKSFKIKLTDKTKTWRGQYSIELNKHPYDLTRVRNKLSFDLFKTMKHMGSLRTVFIRLTVKKNAKDAGLDYGMFTQVEHTNKNYLESHGLDPEANVYFVENFTFQRYPGELKLETDPGFKKERFQKVLNSIGNSDHAKLLAMLDDVNNEALDIDLVIKKHFNRNNYLTWFAMTILMENLDTISQNFTLYSPKNGKGWYFLPWDYDGAWGFVSQPRKKRAEYLDRRWTEGISNWWEVELHKRFLKKPDNLKALQTRMEELMKNELSVEKIQGLLKGYHDGVKACLSKHPDLDFLPVIHPNGAAAKPAEVLAQFETEFNRLPSIIGESYKKFVTTLGRPMPFNIGAIQTEKDQTAFYWNKSYSLTGEPLTYDFMISKTPLFEKADVLIEKLNLDDSKLVSDSPVTARFTIPRAEIPTGTLYWRVIARSAKNPQENWQTPFECFRDEQTLYDGVSSFERP